MSKGDPLASTAQHDLRLYDTFSEPSHITIGDKYTADKSIPTDSRYKGKQILTFSPKTGRTDNILLEKGYKPLAVGDPYIEMEVLERKKHLEETKKRPVKPFIPASPPKKAVGKGSLYGTIDKPPEHMTSGIKELKRGEVKQVPRNFQTNPPKKGGYGYYHTTIGGKEFEYQPDPYGGVKKKVVGQIDHKPITKPFNSTIHGDRIFDSKIFSEEGIKIRSKSEPRKQKAVTVPFKSMSPPRDTIGKFPEYITKEEKITGEEKRNRVKHEKVWKPTTTGTHTVPTKSIALTGVAEHHTLERSRRM